MDKERDYHLIPREDLKLIGGMWRYHQFGKNLLKENKIKEYLLYQSPRELFLIGYNIFVTTAGLVAGSCLEKLISS